MFSDFVSTQMRLGLIFIMVEKMMFCVIV